MGAKSDSENDSDLINDEDSNTATSATSDSDDENNDQETNKSKKKMSKKGKNKNSNLPICNLLKVVSKGKSGILAGNDNKPDIEDDLEILAKRRLQEISVDELLDFTPMFRCVHIYKLLAETTRKNKSS